jgi:hypothetical protein
VDNYEGAFETEMTQPGESRLTKSVGQYAASVPSFVFLGVAAGAMVLSLACQFAGRGRAGRLIAQFASAWLIIGIYNKLVKLEADDRTKPGRNRGYTS